MKLEYLGEFFDSKATLSFQVQTVYGYYTYVRPQIVFISFTRDLEILSNVLSEFDIPHVQQLNRIVINGWSNCKKFIETVFEYLREKRHIGELFLQLSHLRERYGSRRFLFHPTVQDILVELRNYSTRRSKLDMLLEHLPKHMI
ncbi:MAG: hypothetical protein ACTSYJ_11475 [Candidatus Thorarchaeota archaeon]